MSHSVLRALPFAAVLVLAGCKPPPTDADIAGGEPAALEGPSEPIMSPETEGAIWAQSRTPGRLIYGIPGEPSLLAIACVLGDGAPAIRLTRYAEADTEAQAFVALIGNGHVARIPIDATESDGAWLWETTAPADSPDWEVLTGRRDVAVTIPGAGRLVLNPSPLPGELIETCRANAPEAAAIADAAPAP